MEHMTWVGRGGRQQRLVGTRPAASTVVSLFQFASWSLIAACGIFVATILYGILAGYALPTTTIFRLAPILTIAESCMPYAVLVFAATGAAFAWLGSLGLVASDGPRRVEIALARSWNAWALPVIASLCLFSLSAGGWSGHIRASDLNYLSLAGLVPYSDAGGYFVAAFQQARWGEWGVVGSRRPLAEAFRELTVFVAQYSYVATLLVQLALLAIVLYLAARSLSRWRGIWAGCAFVGFMIILERPFFPTTMTEPLGMIWSLFALIFFIEALRQQSLAHALVALAALTVALFTRMGSLLTIPLLVLWVTFVFGATNPRRYRIFAAACGIVLVVAAFNALLGWLYGSSQTTSGANFALTLCGLSLGTDWAGCNSTYATQLGQLADERAQVWFVISQTWSNVLDRPGLFAWRLSENVAKFVLSQPRYFVTGYGRMSWWTEAAAGLATLATLPGLLFTWRHRASPSERWFWLALFLGILLSAAVVYADDGWRTLHVTHAFAACFLALAFAAPGVVSVPRSLRRRRQWKAGAATMGAMAVLLLLVPALSRAQLGREIAAHPPFGRVPANEDIVLGGRAVTGFLVVPDGGARPAAIPALSVAEFARLVESTGIEREMGPFMAGLSDRAPFAFVLAPRLDQRDQFDLYLAPPRVLEDTDVWAWRLTTRAGQPSEASRVTLKDAVGAQPLP